PPAPPHTLPLHDALPISMLESTKGHLTFAAAKLGVTRSQLAGYVERRPPLQTVLHDLREELIDNAESVLRIAIAEKKPWAVKFKDRKSTRLNSSHRTISY